MVSGKATVLFVLAKTKSVSYESKLASIMTDQL